MQVPGSQGGANWQGAVADPESGILYVSSTSTITAMGLGKDAGRSNLDYILTASSRVAGPFGLPLARPPWGTIVALDLNTGKKLWTIANGDAPDYVRKHEKLRGIALPRTGHDDRAGLLVTKSCCSPAKAPACSWPARAAPCSARMTRRPARSCGRRTSACARPASR